MKTLNRKWYTIMLLGIIVSLVSMVAYNHIVFSTNIKYKISGIGSGNVTKISEDIKAYLNSRKEIVQTTAVALDYMMQNNASADEIKEFLVYESEMYRAEVDDDFTGMYGLFCDTYINSVGWVPDESYDAKKRDWYIAATEANGTPVILSPYLDLYTNTAMFSVCQLLSDGKSVISLDISLNSIQKLIENTELSETVYSFVIDGNGLVLAHNKSSEMNKNYLSDESEMKPLIDRIFQHGSGSFEAVLNNKDVTVFANPVLNDMYAVIIVSNDVLFAESKMTLIANIVVCGSISLVIICFFIITVMKINHSVELEMKSSKRVDNMNKQLIRALVRTIEAKDRYTNGHSLRVAEYSKELARRMNKSEKEQEEIYYAGLLHDVGKIRIPAAVINKTGKLTDDEYEQVKIHPVTSYHILKDIYDDKTIAYGAKFHHERYDGKGYPNGLSGTNIPEIARIISVADTYDAMTSNRSYRGALPQDVIRSEIEKGKGTQFDPEIADIMLQIIDEDKTYELRESDTLHKRILVVDDEPINIRLIEHIMKDEPMYTIISANSGAQALEILETQSINLILLDVVMPEMDGFETLARIKEKHSIPAVFMTGDKNIETLEKAAEHGADDYLTKPFFPLTLKEIMRNISS